MNNKNAVLTANVILILATVLLFFGLLLDSPFMSTGPTGSRAIAAIEHLEDIESLREYCGTLALQVESVSRAQGPHLLWLVLYLCLVVTISVVNFLFTVKSVPAKWKKVDPGTSA